MFHEGGIQSGITAAIQQQKLVLCFVYNDDDPVSEDWEHDLLPSLQDLIAEKSVALKMKQHSQEAGFLSAFIPMHIAPAIVVINNGTVIVKLQAPMSADDWREQLQTALRSRDSSVPTPAAVNQSVRQMPGQDNASDAMRHPAAGTDMASAQHAAANSTTDASAGAATTPGPSPSVLQSLMPDRAARLEADQAAKLADEKAARVARAEARRKEIESSTTSTNAKGKQPAETTKDLPPKARTDWVREQAKRKDEAKQERERILKQIEADREERKLRTARNKETVIAAEPMPPQSRGMGSSARTCALQLRLIDGSSIRKQFDADQTLKEDVRRWIKETTTPETVEGQYTFRQLLAPQPSKNIDVADEGRSLVSLGLAPSATLILIPDHSQASRASSGGFSGLVMRIISTLLGIAATFFSSLFGQRGIEAGQVHHEDRDTRGSTTGIDSAGTTSKRRTQTLAESRTHDDRPTEFYNGNSSAFESRKDDDAD